jgi:hypothetical protein
MEQDLILPVINDNPNNTIYENEYFKPAEEDLLFHNRAARYLFVVYGLKFVVHSFGKLKN